MKHDSDTKCSEAPASAFNGEVQRIVRPGKVHTQESDAARYR